MKHSSIKSLICGLLIGIIGTIGAVSITNIYASESINTCKDNEIKVFFNNSRVPLKNPLVKNDSKVYMPIIEILDYLGYNAKWNASKNSINISKDNEANTINTNRKNIKPTTSQKNTVDNEADKLALEIMQKTGNWSYVEPLFSYMTSNGVKDMVNLYINEKGGNMQKVKSAFPNIDKDNFTISATNKLITKSDYDTLANKTLTKTNDLFSILVYLPYMSSNKIDSLVKDYINKTGNFNLIYNIREYMSTKAIDDTVKNYIDKTGDYGSVAAILEFMSTDASKYIAEKYINESNSKEYIQFYEPYLKH